MRFRLKILRGLIAIAQSFGTKLRDVEGKVLCRAFIVCWRGKIHLIGLPNYVHLRPVPVPQPRLSYWRQAVSWEQVGPPDFPRLGKPAPPSSDKLQRTCHIIICHASPPEAELIYRTWRNQDPNALALIAYGGTEENFNNLSESIKAVFVPDFSLRTKDHARERQEYSGVFRKAVAWMAVQPEEITHVHVVEYDVFPAAKNVGALLYAALLREDADVIGYGLYDFTGTIHPQNRHQLADPDFSGFISSSSKRENSSRLITMLGCSSYWSRPSFDEVATLKGVPPVYLEVAIPTLAHHLGYRVRPVPAFQEKFVTFEGDLTSCIRDFEKQGAWLVHPCKHWIHPQPSAEKPATS